MNRAMIIGYVGQDPESRYMPDGTCVTSLSVATNSRWTDKQSGERKERTEWHRCSAWGRQAEVLAEYVRKGSQIYIEGELQTRKWQDKDGNDRWTTEIRVRNFEFLGGRPNDNGERGERREELQPRQSPEDRAEDPNVRDRDFFNDKPPRQDYDDDIPF